MHIIVVIQDMYSLKVPCVYGQQKEVSTVMYVHTILASGWEVISDKYIAV